MPRDYSFGLSIYKLNVFFKIVILLVFVSCSNRPITPEHSYVFRYIDKTTGDTAIMYAKKEKKNILLIFSGWSFSSNPRMEWKTLAQFEDHDKIQESFILAWLPVDDKRLAKGTTQIVF